MKRSSLYASIFAHLSAATFCLPAVASSNQPSPPAAMHNTTAASAPASHNTLQTDKDRTSYALGLAIARGFQPIAQYIDAHALQRAVNQVLSGGPPLITKEQAQATDAALRSQLLSAKNDKTGNHTSTPNASISKENVGLMLGTFAIGPTLQPYKDGINTDVMIQGLQDLLSGRPQLLNDQQANELVKNFILKQKQAIGEKNRKEGAAFLQQNAHQKGVQTTSSGLQYLVLRQGTGKHPLATQTVRVNYEGRLLNGTVFDSSYTRGTPAELNLAQVIPGWSQGIPLMTVGSKYRFWVPSELAYGENGAPGGGIGPNATLVFDVELIDILPSQSSPASKSH